MTGVLSQLRALHRERGVRRAWPGTDGTLTLEVRDAAGALRAGRLGPDGLELTMAGRDRRLPGLADAAARGEVLVLNDTFCVRINEIVPGVKEEGM